jgi:hypothetical protein
MASAPISILGGGHFMSSTYHDPAWLAQKYTGEGLSTYAIGRLVGRDSKTIHTWLVKLGIPTRKRTWAAEPTGRPHQDAAWLRREYVDRQRSAAEIAAEIGVTPENIIFYLRRFGIPRRNTSETRAVKRWGMSGESNPMYGKRGTEVPSWKGGRTPERQAFYSSLEWKAAVREVEQRDGDQCRRCGAQHQPDKRRFHIHHIAPFSVKELRAEVSNLVTLCNPCHGWVHSKHNTEGLFVRKGGAD